MPTPSEMQVLASLSGGNVHSVEHVANWMKVSPDAVRRLLAGLEEQGLVRVEREKKTEWALTPKGHDAISKGGLPEQYLVRVLEKGAREMKDLQSSFSNPQEFSAAFGLAKRSSWIEVKSEGGKSMILLTSLGKKSVEHSPLWNLLESLSRGELLSPDSPALSELAARGLVSQKTISRETIQITQKGAHLQETTPQLKSEAPVIGLITPEIIEKKRYVGATLKPYDVTAGVEPRYPGRIHPLRHVIEDVRRVMVELGFSEQESPLVESSFWNMDIMFIPQDHPAREIQDTFYLPGRATLPDADLVKRIKATHEHGGKTGSKGFGYEWDPKIAAQLLLRTHGSATTFRTLAANPTPPLKTFSIGRVFRNEAIDATHLAEFYQVDGLVMGEGLTLRHLMGIISEFYARLGVTRIKFKPTYNPYTEPSMEALAYHPTLKKWVEIINSGMFRPETLRPLGINVPVISWGFGLERLALFTHQKATLKEIAGPDVDLDWIRSYNGSKHRLDEGKN